MLYLLVPFFASNPKLESKRRTKWENWFISSLDTFRKYNLEDNQIDDYTPSIGYESY